MRIGFNAFFLSQAGTGSGQYTYQLLRALAQVDSDYEYFLYDTKKPGFLNSVQVLRTPFTQRVENLDKLWFEQIAFPLACRRACVALCHVPYFASPLCPTVPTVVTVHDLIPLLLPVYRGNILVRLYMRLVAAAARRATRIITDSCASRDDIIEHLRVPAERVHVIYLAADPTCRRVLDETALAAVRQKYRLPEQYILYLGGFDQRKNLSTLLRAYQQLLPMMDNHAPPLVVAGRLPSADTPFFPNPRRMATELGVEHHVLFPGWIAEEDKPALYSAALFFVFLSLYEGFGLMPLEAMSCGTAVLAARRASLPEIVAGGGVLVDATNVDEVSAAMLALLRDSALRQQLGQAALAQATKFDWLQTAKQTVQVYNLAAGR